MIQQILASEADTESRLDRFLRKNVPGLTQAMLQKLLRSGAIRVDGKRAEASTRLAAGAVVKVPEIKPPEKMPRQRHVVALDEGQKRDFQATVLYRDDAVIVLNKPAGLASQGGKGIAVHVDGMLDALTFGGDERPKLVHRLDRDTSGVLVLARTARAAQKLAAGFRGRDVEKIYWALLWGVPPVLEGRIDLALVRVDGEGSSRAEPAEKGDKDADRALTAYKIIDYAGKKFAWAEMQPLTGRMHQLRAHALALGTPIVGDAAYGAAFAEGFAPQLHLHARRLKIMHPDGGTLSVEAPLPPHMKQAFGHLGFTAPEAAKPKRIERK
jgi:23S rRNA pseudouridine955/2504/2580 synthase